MYLIRIFTECYSVLIWFQSSAKCSMTYPREHNMKSQSVPASSSQMKKCRLGSPYLTRVLRAGQHRQDSGQPCLPLTALPRLPFTPSPSSQMLTHSPAQLFCIYTLLVTGHCSIACVCCHLRAVGICICRHHVYDNASATARDDWR